MEELKQEIRLPRLGEPAPDFEAVTTQGTIKLEDYKGGRDLLLPTLCQR